MVGDAATRRELAIDGGPRVRTRPPPARKVFAEDELRSVTRVFEESWEEGRDFGFQGTFEALYTERYCAYHGGGHADAVNSGTAAIFVALKALDLPAGSDVVVSPVTNSADPMAIVLAGLNPVLADSARGSYNVDPASLERAITPRTGAALLTHASGFPLDMEGIMRVADGHGVRVIEDCSQAHGALWNGRRVGTFGAMAVASTGFAKTLATGGTGGIVFTRDEDLYWRARAHADRGKPFFRPDFDVKAPGAALFPALNFNLDELSAAIGLSVLARLDDINRRRLELYEMLGQGLAQSRLASVYRAHSNIAVPALFHCPVVVEADALSVSTKRFAEAVAAEGIWLNPHYRELVAEWPWFQERFGGASPNAVAFRDSSFNVLYHEGFTEDDIGDIVAAILKVERAYAR